MMMMAMLVSQSTGELSSARSSAGQASARVEGRVEGLVSESTNRRREKETSTCSLPPNRTLSSESILATLGDKKFARQLSLR